VKKQKKLKPTMIDVAKLAGVSQTTVSFVINENPGIPEDTKDRVLAAIAEIGYLPNIVARHMRTRRTNMIGLVADEIATTPYAGQIIKGAQDAAWKNGKILLNVNIDDEPGLERTGLEILLERQVEGIIYATMFHRPVDPHPFIFETNSVLLDCFDPNGSLPSVVPDEIGGGYTATRFLIEQGHRSIGFINNMDDIPATGGRMAGYQQALEESGLPYRHEFVCAEESNAKGGYRAAVSLFQRSEGPTALFCFNDRMAMGAYDALRKLGLRIPDDVAVVGFDNQEIIADNLYPRLTTLQLPHYEMGEWAVNFLINNLEQANPENPIQHKIGCPLVRRESA